jgi:hypothetical protein
MSFVVGKVQGASTVSAVVSISRERRIRFRCPNHAEVVIRIEASLARTLTRGSHDDGFFSMALLAGFQTLLEFKSPT